MSHPAEAGTPQAADLSKQQWRRHGRDHLRQRLSVRSAVRYDGRADDFLERGQISAVPRQEVPALMLALQPETPLDRGPEGSARCAGTTSNSRQTVGWKPWIAARNHQLVLSASGRDSACERLWHTT